MANEQNLIPFDKRSESQARELGQKGGIASGKARRAKREAREWAKIALDEMLKGKHGEDVPTRYAMIKKQIQKAVGKGDTASFEKVLRLAGEWEQESGGSVVIVNNYNGLTAEAREAMEHVDEL
jgi:hypothetical protein